MPHPESLHRVGASTLFPIIADTTIRLWHIGDYAHSWEDAEIDRQRLADFDYRFEVTRQDG